MSAVSRRALLGGALLPLAGCSLRLESGATLPGADPAKPSDLEPLTAIRANVANAITAAGKETKYSQIAAEALRLHRTQLVQIDRHIKALGGKPGQTPSVSTVPSAAPTSASSPSASSSGAASASGQPSASPSAPVNGWTTISPTSQPATAWTRAEAAWSQTPTIEALAQLSDQARPMAVSAGAVALTFALRAGTSISWAPGSTVPASAAPQLEQLTTAATTALSWLAARSNNKNERARYGTWLQLLTASQSLAQQAAPSANPSAGPHAFADAAAARASALSALKSLEPACAKAATTAKTTKECSGLLLVSTAAAAAQAELGDPISAFPGMEKVG